MEFWDTFLDILRIIGSAMFMIVFFGLCIFVHELGHFLAARMCKLHVVAFSIGFKKIWAKKINGVEYRIGCIPVGGYVDLPQIDGSGDPKDENDNPLPKAEPWKRIVVAFAGPFFNVLFALLIGCAVWFYGIPQSSPKMQEFKVLTVQEESPEYAAGLRPGDVIVKLNGKTFNRTWTEFSQDIMLTVGDVELTVRRGQEEYHVKYKPVVNEQIAPNAKIAYPFFTPEIPVVVVPEAGSAAEKAGLLEGDKILTVNGEPVSLDDFLLIMQVSAGKPLDVEYERMENDKTVTGHVILTPEADPEYFIIGVRYVQDEAGSLTIESTIPGSPADGRILPGDTLYAAADGTELKNRENVAEMIQSVKNEPLTLQVKRGNELVHVTLTPVSAGKAGVTFQFIAYPTPFEQLWQVLDKTWRSLRSVSAGIGYKMGLNKDGYTTLGPQHFSGPIGIGDVLYRSVYQGSLIIGLSLVVMISFSLGLFNLLPIPVLDGGHILLALLQIIFRRPVSEKVLTPITYFFMFLLIAFMIFVTFFDVKRLLPAEAKAPGKILDTSDAAPAEAVPVQPETATDEAKK